MMNANSMILLAIGVLTAVNCQSLPRLEYHGRSLPNNSFFCHPDIGEGDSALKCVTDNVNCCNNSNIGNWTDQYGRLVQQETYNATLLYTTRGDGVINLNRRNGSAYSISGVWVCFIPDSSGEIQSLHVHIKSYGNYAIYYV